MTDYELFCQIKHLKEHEKLTAAQIAAKLSIDGRTVAKWLNRDSFCLKKKTPRPS